MGGGNARPTESVVGLTAQALSCAAKAHVPKPTRRSACTHVSRAMQAARRREVRIKRGGSAAGPKPGRASFCGELGRAGGTANTKSSFNIGLENV